MSGPDDVEGGPLRYPGVYDEMASTGRAVHLVREAGLDAGVILDLGCGAGAVAEPLRDSGFEYIGTDVDRAGLDAVAARGFEVHEVDLTAPADRLAAELVGLLAGRPLRAVLALDVLEHLSAPSEALRAIRATVLAAGTEASVPLVVSIPNVTHRDVAAKLLLGRWDVDQGGLLDDTHLRFFSEHEVGRLVAAGGWDQDGRADVVAEISDQCFPDDAPTLRPGAPLRELLIGVRGDAGPSATTYQFVRRLRVSPEGPRPAPHHHVDDEALPLLGAVVLGEADATEALRGDLAAQTLAVDHIEQVAPGDDLASVLRQLPTRMVAVLDGSSRLAPGWAAAVADAVATEPGRVVQVPVALTSGPPGPHTGWGDATVDPLEVFDPLHVVLPRPGSASGAVVPVEMARTAGVVPVADLPVARAANLWVGRSVQLVGRRQLDGPALVALPVDKAVDAAAVHRDLVADLDRRPLLLPSGSASRLAALRRRAARAEQSEAELGQRLFTTQAKLQGVTDYVHRTEAELAFIRPELDRLRAEHARKPSRRLAALVRRLFG